jgi:hypothetical protein
LIPVTERSRGHHQPSGAGGTISRAEPGATSTSQIQGHQPPNGAKSNLSQKFITEIHPDPLKKKNNLTAFSQKALNLIVAIAKTLDFSA